ncbi:HD domain-containing protein [Pseudomonas baetica]|uniref:HD domain-containing protein n=1 Tax=Pseudomonas baetica TaxID=674054 RepID=UPI002405BBB0|nr:HD domain-containing protein [Pseudomonas baetica]MDF9779119.1 (p)ppGpp synthase/HD superfamily hydrolase [Pseudomonas baetica]
MSDHLIERAEALATEWHQGELRKYSLEPYIEHPRTVAAIIRSVPQHTWELVAAALLHDVLEVPEPIRSQRIQVIRRELGEVVLQYVLEVSNPSRPEDGNRKTRKAIDRAHLAKASPGGQTLRLADAVHNLHNLNELSPTFAKLYASEKQLILPLTLSGDPALHSRVSMIILEILSS